MVAFELGTQSRRNGWHLVLIAPFPSFLFCLLDLNLCREADIGLQRSIFCAATKLHPLFILNLLFLVNVCILFWLVSLYQQSTWLIDPYWTIAPVLIGHFYRQYCTESAPDNARQLVSLALLWLWSVRLTHSYIRREKWSLGAREDWRYADMRARYGGQWWWMSFFLVYAVQQLMLVGISLPLYSVHASAQPWNPIWDGVAAAGCLLGIGIAAVADTQLHEFIMANERRQSAGKPPVLLLDTGLWRYSRHPNYFGEQLWWWSLGLFAVNVGQPWALAGTLFNSLCMIGVTRLTEARMLARPERAALFTEYQRRTSVWVPWFQRSCRTKQM